MDNEQKLRIKSAMIMYALETSLGNYVTDNTALDVISEGTKNAIVDREISRGRDIPRDNINAIIEASYLNEIFGFALDAAEGTSHKAHVRNLKEYCSLLGIFEIRNAISHPNRSFPDTYWFKAAAIASDPLILKLGLDSVRHALNCAIAESLNAPPDEWLHHVKWAIPNSLPSSFDHEITGLLGREKEFKDLESTLSKARNSLIAVVAPGGVGKTALILQFLREVSLSPEWSKSIHTIIFCTLKNEHLTANGIEVVEAINGLEQIKNAIFKDLRSIYSDENIESFDHACSTLSEERILICIDNLETLLVRSQSEFIEFNQQLPLHWKVIVTSRISIESATTVPLEPLGKKHAVNLSRNYMRKRGVNDFSQDVLELIAKRANNNPLAIRLTIDLYIRGVDISQSIQQSQKDIASFSYKNLIESLKPNSISILEAIYVIGESTKSQLMDLLQLSNEEVAESINELSKTSLIGRSTSESGNDKLNLSDSIRDLLLTNPKNIEIRSRISEGIKERRDKILAQISRNQKLGLTEFDDDYVHPGTDSTLHVLVLDLNKFISKHPQKRRHGELVQIKNRFVDILTHNSNDYQLYYHYSRVLKILKDFAGELQMLNRASVLEPKAARCLLAIALRKFNNGVYDEAKDIFDKLIVMGYDKPGNSSKRFSFTVTKVYLLCLLYQGDYDSIFEKTEGWQIDPNWSVLLGTYRATTYKRSTELKRDQIDETEFALSESMNIFNTIFKLEDYVKIACVEAYKVIQEIGSLFGGYSYSGKSRYTEKFVHHYLAFVANHYFNIISSIEDQQVDSAESGRLLRKLYSIELSKYANPLHTARWYHSEFDFFYDDDDVQRLVGEGHEIVTIYRIPESESGAPHYLFAKNQDEKQFYLHVDCFVGGWSRWGYLKLNQKLAIQYEEMSRNEKAARATKIVEIERM